MNKLYIILYAVFSAPLFLFAQHDAQTSILTGDGIFTVSQTDEGKDMIVLNIALWDDMVKGTKYTSINLKDSKCLIACIQISDKKQMHCKTGIGFRCGIFDCSHKIKATTVLVNKENRICSIRLQKTGSDTVKIIFLDRVDWCGLQNDD